MKRSDQRRRTPPLPRNTPSTGLERATQFFHFQTQAGRFGGYQWFNAYGSGFDFTDAHSNLMRFY